jgi:UDP-glucose 6-dehydrogenase
MNSRPKECLAKKVKRLNKQYEENKYWLELAETAVNREEKVALVAYQKMQAKRKLESDRDALLYHYDVKMISGK